MASAEEYRQQVSDLGLDHMEIGASSLAEGKAALADVRRLQKELRQIKRNVNLEMKTVRTQYKARIAAAGTSGWTGLLAMGRGGSRYRASEKRRVRAERDSKLAPYDEVKLTIDDLLVQMDGAKLQLQEFIEEAKAEEKADKQAARAKASPEKSNIERRFCPQCGKPVDAEDVFCRWCGHGLDRR
jgi:F0F1-type ATP synthase membrane subunit b/b'